MSGTGTKDDPWLLKTPPGTSEYTMYRDDERDPPAIVCQAGKTTLMYDARVLDDLRAMLVEHGDWMPLGSADEQKPAKEGTVEAWARSESNPVGGWYGLRKGYRGRVGMYITADGGARPRRGRAQPAQQPHAGGLTRRRST